MCSKSIMIRKSRADVAEAALVVRAVQAAILPPRIRKKITDFRRAVPLPFLKKRELAKTNQKEPKGGTLCQLRQKKDLLFLN